MRGSVYTRREHATSNNGEPLAGLPRGALIVLIGRGDEFIVPNGGTVIEAGDRLLMLAGEEDLGKTRSIVEEEESKK
jgi:cell volume regulation protein A